MNSIRFNIRQIKSRPLSSLLNILLFATGVTIISLIFVLRDSFENQMEKNAGSIDLVVGAKGSPLQLILSGVYQVDYPTGNIDYQEAMALSKNPLIKQAIPLALGDNYAGFRIVGTNEHYLDIYPAELKEGVLWQNDLEVTIGAKVASQTGLTIGSQFSGEHGFLDGTGHTHGDNPYTVKGIFKASGTVLDQLILTNIGSVWKIHESHEGHDDHDDHADHDHDHADHNHGEAETHEHHDHDHHDHDHDHADHDHADHDHEAGQPCNHEEHLETEGKEITSLLIQYQNPMGVITLPRLINQSTNMQAASPAIEINRLYSLLGIGIQALTFISGLIILISALSIFISLLNSLKERKYELALIRVMGGSRFRLFSILLLEGISFALIGYLIGFMISRIAMIALSAYTENNFHYTLQEWVAPTDLWLLLLSLAIGAVASIIPAIKAMHTDISKTLSE
ncbi:ABC transporter permease [Parabacteroides sp. PF5-9]|uniref:ABC transporter permease n=1 Tax=Parabacteroides sp. PF5-9 TaxID=1742404 RepID=UPI002473736B|nr:ABC transporter permease [Parabacteroides sp. PF5-9]MDH6357290.1 putative ABC transport system permease protein [Parabacteroides sp. PF5-9]